MTRWIVTNPKTGQVSAIECTKRTADWLRKRGWTVLPA